MIIKKIIILAIIILSYSVQISYAGKITNGTNVPQGKYPFFVAIGKQSEAIDAKFGGYCGGSLIAPHWVVTAMHCVLGATEKLQVAVGSADLSDPSSYQHANVIQFFFYPGPPVNPDFPFSGKDIALLKLDRDITLPPIEIAQQKPQKNMATAIGQGAINESGERPLVVNEVDIPVTDNKDCFSPDLKKLNLEITNKEICAGANSGIRKNIFHGDSGGPLIQKINGQYVLIGVTARITTLDLSVNAPAIFTDISAYYPWIMDVINNESTHTFLSPVVK